ncbi:hypothetical protein Avbf_15492 [Armadillidium vulgare]|nr:hypothetical protein Avbf_15492 [Armadillidium vulgare]
MIAMINFICGSNILPETLFKLFAPLKTYDSFEMHFYCAKCKKTHTSEDNRDTKMVCCDTICTNYFITFNMKEKIEKFLTVNNEPSSRNKNKEKEIIFGSISFPEKPFLTISRRPKHNEDLSQRSLPGKKYYNSKEIKQPLTPEKRFAIEEAFKDRLKKQQYHDATIAVELKLVNRYIAEKINDG